MTTKKSVTAKDKSAKAFENLPELNIEKQRIKDLSKLVNSKIETIKGLQDEIGNQQAQIDFQNKKLSEASSIITSQVEKFNELSSQISFVTKLNDDLKSILKQTIDKLVYFDK